MTSRIIIFLTIIITPTIARSDYVTYQVDITHNDQFGSDLPMRVFGSIIVDADIADISAAVHSSSLLYQFDGETPPVELSLFFNAGGPDLGFVAIGDELYVQGTGLNNQVIQWASPGVNFVAFDVGSGPLNNHAGLVDNRELDSRAWLDGDTTSGNGYLLGTDGVAIPESVSIWLLMLMGLSAFLTSERRRFS